MALPLKNSAPEQHYIRFASFAYQLGINCDAKDLTELSVWKFLHHSLTGHVITHALMLLKPQDHRTWH
jgi:hypothetical protein